METGHPEYNIIICMSSYLIFALFSAQVLVFLDSHCEVNTNWLEPLLSPIHVDPSTVTIPIVDIIDQDTFRYEASPLVRGGFNWGMHFRWDNIPQSWYRSHGVADNVP